MATYYVDPMGLDEDSGGAEDAPWATIDFAHRQAKVTDGDTLKLAYGTYTETLNISKALTITAAITDPAISPRPIITTLATGGATITAKASTGAQTYEYLDIRDVEGGGGNYAVVIEADTDARTFTNCLFTGGAIGCVRATGNNGALTFEDCTFTGTNNSGTITNYALLVYNAALEVTDCTVTGTFDDFAMQAASTNLQAVSITGCTIGNSQKFPSGGLFVNAASSATISNNTISLSATDQAGDIIKVTNVPTTVIDSNDITLLSTSTATSADVIEVTSTGTAMPNVRISNNAIRTRQTAGHVIIVGGEASGTHNRKLDGAIIEFNRVWGPVFYGTAASSVTEHGCMIGFSAKGQIRYNYVNGVGYGCIAKAGAVVAATAEADDETFTTGAAHGLSVGQPVWFTSLGTAEGIAVNTKYYVASVPGATSFTVSATLGGSAVDVTADGSVTYDTLNWEGQGGIHHNITVNCSTNHIALSGVMGVVVEYNTCYQGVAAGSTGRPMIRQKKDDSVNAYCFGTTVKNNICYGYANNYVFGQDQAGHTGTAITNNCFYMPGTTNLFNLDNTPSNWATFATAYPTGNINVDPKFKCKGSDFRLVPTSPCINPYSTSRLTRSGTLRYIPQLAYGAIPPIYDAEPRWRRAGAAIS